ncbi:PEP-CTERM sorting domain-containing protein [Thiobacillus denitrificans]|uniref:PEP-CTERM sorting domain-containing protein n=1 Tax=Thiobacillus denitrificans TaxID=36861 RepID=UPI0009D98365|nr:PEP-CTERM sorting domain-containing protein [Thiobacillus denitrificans]
MDLSAAVDEMKKNAGRFCYSRSNGPVCNNGRAKASAGDGVKASSSNEGKAMKFMSTELRHGTPQALVVALVLVSLIASSGARAAQAIVGSWYTDLQDVHITTTFLDDGTYFEAADYAADVSHTGVEWGTYIWNEATGEVTAISQGDTNGDWGLANDVNGTQYVTRTGNTVSLTQPGCAGCTDISAQIIVHPANSIVGTWLLPAANGAGTLSFFSDGTYMMGQGGVSDAFGQPGVERGTYTWDSITGQLIATSVITDTNGEWGLSNPQGLLTATLGAGGSLYASESGNFIGVFLAAPAPVPEPATSGMLLAGLGLVATMAWRMRPAHLAARST